MTSPAPSDGETATVATNLRAIARSLADIAETVARESAETTEAVRHAAGQARETAVLAAELDAIAQQVEHTVRLQAKLLASARDAAGGNITIVDGLGGAADRIGTISAMIGDIAGRSRLLALNARIEAARAGDDGRGFGVVANEMSMLAQSTLSATRDIEERTGSIHADVAATRNAFESAIVQVDRERELIDEISMAVNRQKSAASEVARLSDTTTEGIEDVAVAIGRVASAAITAKLIARQIIRAADTLVSGQASSGSPSASTRRRSA